MAGHAAGPPSPATPQAAPPLSTAWHVALVESHKVEDISIVATSKHFSSGISLYAVADGHNGRTAARAVHALLPAELDRQLGPGPASGDAVVRALARTFLALDEVICRQFASSGCTLTVAVVSGDTLTLAHVGDSHAMLDTGAEVVRLTSEHRIGLSPAEQARLEASGGRLCRLNEWGSGPSVGMHDGLGPIRLWPGGIMVGRAIGDRDVGEILLPHPHIRQLRIPPTGARLVLATDGLWDTMPPGRVARILRQHALPKAAATQAVSAVAASRNGMLTDDATVVVVDFVAPGTTFRDLLRQFQGRVRAVLSSPELATLGMAEADAGAAEPQPQQAQPQQPPQQPQPQPQPRRGLFACFGRPAVVEAPQEQAPPLRNISAYSGRREPSLRGGSMRADFSASSGRYPRDASSSLRGGSERSVRGGLARDPSVRGAMRAATLELLCNVDTAEWTAAHFGRPPSPQYCATPSRGSTDSCHQRCSPRGTLDGGALGNSVGSLSSEDFLADAQAQHKAIPRGSGAPAVGEKKCRGSNAAAALLFN